MKSERKWKYSSQWLVASLKSTLCNIRYDINQFLRWDEQIGTNAFVLTQQVGVEFWCELRLTPRTGLNWGLRSVAQQATLSRCDTPTNTHHRLVRRSAESASICCCNLEAVQNKGLGCGGRFGTLSPCAFKSTWRGGIGHSRCSVSTVVRSKSVIVVIS